MKKLRFIIIFVFLLNLAKAELIKHNNCISIFYIKNKNVTLYIKKNTPIPIKINYKNIKFLNKEDKIDYANNYINISSINQLNITNKYMNNELINIDFCDMYNWCKIENSPYYIKRSDFKKIITYKVKAHTNKKTYLYLSNELLSKNYKIWNKIKEYINKQNRNIRIDFKNNFIKLDVLNKYLRKNDIYNSSLYKNSILLYPKNKILNILYCDVYYWCKIEDSDYFIKMNNIKFIKSKTNKMSKYEKTIAQNKDHKINRYKKTIKKNKDHKINEYKKTIKKNKDNKINEYKKTIKKNKDNTINKYNKTKTSEINNIKMKSKYTISTQLKYNQVKIKTYINENLIKKDTLSKKYIGYEFSMGYKYTEDLLFEISTSKTSSKISNIKKVQSSVNKLLLTYGKNDIYTGILLGYKRVSFNQVPVITNDQYSKNIMEDIIYGIKVGFINNFKNNISIFTNYEIAKQSNILDNNYFLLDGIKFRLERDSILNIGLKYNF